MTQPNLFRLSSIALTLAAVIFIGFGFFQIQLHRTAANSVAVSAQGDEREAHFTPCPNDPNRTCYTVSPKFIRQHQREPRRLLADYFLILLGLLSLLSAALLSRSARDRRASAAWLREHGVLLETSCAGIHNSYRFGRKRFRLLCEWTDPQTAAVYRFESPSLDFNPGELVQRRQIPVYVLPGDYTKYLVDISWLSPLAGKNYSRFHPGT